MGAKRLKAIAVRGSRLPRCGRPAARWQPGARSGRAQRRPGDRQVPRDRHRRPMSPSSIAWRLLPTRNFAGGQLRRARGDLRRDAAPGAPHRPARLRRLHRRLRASLPHATGRWPGDLGAAGVRDALRPRLPLRGERPERRLRAAALCDELGMDAISRRGHGRLGDGVPRARVDLGVPADEIPRLGDGAAVLAHAEADRRRGKGSATCWPRESRAAAERVGQGSDAWAMHVKGLELPGYDPRKLKTLALGLAVAAARRLPQPLVRLRGRLLRSPRPPRPTRGQRASGGRGRGPGGAARLADPLQVPAHAASTTCTRRRRALRAVTGLADDRRRPARGRGAHRRAEEAVQPAPGLDARRTTRCRRAAWRSRWPTGRGRASG